MTPLHARLLAAALAAAPTVAFLVPAAGANAPVPASLPATAPTGYDVAPAQVVGWTSCAASSCHGGQRPKLGLGAEHTTWANSDPHSKAFAVLHQARSKRMVELLAEKGGPPVVPAHRNELCLRCHGAAPANLSAALNPSDDLHRVGSCENCHGAADKWLTTHYLPGWKALNDCQKATHGMLPTKDLAYRAKVCNGCHVGEPGREVDHRLIAAGHPALRFEFAGYQAEPVYVKHWVEKGYGPDVEAWQWVIGQVAASRSAADLLRHRAAEAEQAGRREWPELSEYACFSCHRDLTPGTTLGAKSLRDPATAPRPGALPWGSWYHSVPLELTKATSPEWVRPTGPAENLSGLADLFRKNDRPRPEVARDAAAAAVADLDRWLAALQANACRQSATSPLSPGDVRAMLNPLLGFAERIPGTSASGTDWDRHAQGFLGTAALYRTLTVLDPAARNPGPESALKTVAADLSFPPGRDGPRRWEADDEARFTSRWAALRAVLGSPSAAR